MNHTKPYRFVLYGIFAGLLLSGVITHVPIVALGIGCAVIAGLALLPNGNNK